jgi:hypothetical protein
MHFMTVFAPLIAVALAAPSVSHSNENIVVVAVTDA